MFLNGKVHSEYRKSLNVLFTPKALECYLRVQDQIYRQHFKQWLADPNPNPQPYQLKFRDLNMMTSLRVFCGSYIAEAAAQEVSDKYWLITQALELVNFPFAFPGTKVWHACRAREVAVKHLMKAAADSKAAMRKGKEADCLLDQWVEQILEGKVREFSDKEMALVLLSFIFASQGGLPNVVSRPRDCVLIGTLPPQTPCRRRSPLPSSSSPTTRTSSRASATSRPASAPAISSRPSPSPRSTT